MSWLVYIVELFDSIPEWVNKILLWGIIVCCGYWVLMFDNLGVKKPNPYPVDSLVQVTALEEVESLAQGNGKYALVIDLLVMEIVNTRRELSYRRRYGLPLGEVVREGDKALGCLEYFDKFQTVKAAVLNYDYFRVVGEESIKDWSAYKGSQSLYREKLSLVECTGRLGFDESLWHMRYRELEAVNRVRKLGVN